MKKRWLLAGLLVMVFILSGCTALIPPTENLLNTKEKAQALFDENFPLIDAAAQLLWEHHAELDSLVSEGESRVNLYSRGRKETDFPYNRMSLTAEEKATIFAAWRILDPCGLSVTYHMALSNQAPVIALHCGYDEAGHSFGCFYIRPVAEHEEGMTPQDTVARRIERNNYSNPKSYAQWYSLDHDNWYQGTTAYIRYRAPKR